MTQESMTVASNLALDEAVSRRRAAGEPILHLGFGESRLPLFPGLVDSLATGAGRTAYGPVAGDEAVRIAVAGYLARRRIPADPDQVVVGPGSKSLLMAVVAAVRGDVLLPRPSWVTYAPQARLFEREVRFVPVPQVCGGAPEPGLLAEAVAGLRAGGGNPRLLVLTSPDNPTGTLVPPEVVVELCAIAEKEDLLIVSDEIYRDVVFDEDARLLSPAEVMPERTVVTTGLSKSLALGGWRIGAARFPAGRWGSEIRQRVLGVASQSWSSLAGPMQSVAEYAFSEPVELVAHVAASTRLHGAVARALHKVVTSHGASCRPPTGAFYLYPDLESIRDPLGRRGVGDSAALERHLLEDHGVAVLGGHHFGDEPGALRFRMATSLLYGADDEQRWESLRSDEPLELPQIAGPLAELDHVFALLKAE
jgi:aspartate aminotransferase